MSSCFDGSSTLYSSNSSAPSLRSVIATKDVIVTVDSHNEVRVLDIETYAIAYSFMLSSSAEGRGSSSGGWDRSDDQIESIDIHEGKIIGMCTAKGDVCLKNLYAEDFC